MDSTVVDGEGRMRPTAVETERRDSAAPKSHSSSPLRTVRPPRQQTDSTSKTIIDNSNNNKLRI